MPVEFLTDAQVAVYGRFAGPPTRAQLDRFFLLHDDDRRRVALRRQPHTQLGFGVQLETVRFLGTFLADPLDVPPEVVAYIAGQLELDPACFPAYAARAMTPYEHTWEIRRAYGYRNYAAAEQELHAFLAARARTSNEGPRALFDRATAWLIKHKVLLPGATTLARAIVAIRANAAEHLWHALSDGVDAALRQRLEGLLDVETGALLHAERLRTSPSRVSGSELVRALERVAAVRQLGASAVDVSAAPPGRVAALARYGMAAKAPHLRQLTGTRRIATLLATVRQLEQVAIDDVLDLLDVLLATKARRPRSRSTGATRAC